MEIADDFDEISPNVSFMFETIPDRIQACQKHADIISTDIFKINDIEMSDEVNFDSVIVSSWHEYCFLDFGVIERSKGDGKC